MLVEVFQQSWQRLTAGKPIVATAPVYAQLSYMDLLEIWDKFAARRRGETRQGRFDEDLGWLDFYPTKMNGRRVWVIENSQAFTIMYREDF